MCAGSLRWMKVPRPESFETTLGQAASRVMPARQADRPCWRKVFQHAGVLQDEGHVGTGFGESRGVRHLRREDLQVEAEAIVGEPRDVALD